MDVLFIVQKHGNYLDLRLLLDHDGQVVAQLPRVVVLEVQAGMQGCGKVFGAWEPIICAWKYA